MKAAPVTWARGARLFHHRPMAMAALGLCAGILLGARAGSRAAALLAAGLCLCGALAQALGVRRLVALLACMGLGVCRAQLARPPEYPASSGVRLTGRICEAPERSESGVTLTLNRAALDGAAVSGRVLLTIASPAFPAEYGGYVEADARISPARAARNEGGFDQQMWDWSRGVACRAYAPGAALYPGGPGLYGRLLALRGWMEDTLLALYGPINGPLATGMLLGDKRALAPDILSDFRDAGIAHLLAVSGLHVGVLIAGLRFLLRNRRAGTRLAVIALFLLFYCALAAFSASTVRASVMALCLLFAEALRRRNDPLSALSFACVVILLWSPFSLFTAGFLLSFSAVLGILLLQAPLSACFARLGGVGEGLSVSLAAQLGTLAPTAALFGRVPFTGLLANLLVVPLAGLALFPALLAPPLYALCAPLGRCFALSGSAVLTLMRAVAERAARPGALTLAAPSLGACLLLLIAFVFLSRYCMAALRQRLALGGLCLLLSLFLWILPARARPVPSLTVLDTGQGYAAHLRDAAGDTLLGSEAGLASAALAGYCRYHAIEDAPRETGAPGMRALLGDTAFTLYPGRVAVNGQSYDLSRTGQLRFWYARDGTLRVRAYG